MPHNLATIQNGTGDGWVIMDEFSANRFRTGDNIYVKGVPTADMCTTAAERAKSYNKYSNNTAAADTLTFTGTGGAESVTTPKLADVEKEDFFVDHKQILLDYIQATSTNNPPVSGNGGLFRRSICPMA